MRGAEADRKSNSRTLENVKEHMNHIQERPEEKVFSTQDLVVWHFKDGKQTFPIPAVVVREEGKSVIIRARVEGSIRQIQVDSANLTSR